VAREQAKSSQTTCVNSAGAPRSARSGSGAWPSTAHPLVSTLYKQLKARYPLIQLAVREGPGLRSLRRGSRTAASISPFFIAPAGSPKNGDTHLVEDLDLSGRRRWRPADVPADGCRFQPLHNLPLVLFLSSEQAGATTSSTSAPSVAFRSMWPWEAEPRSALQTQNRCARRPLCPCWGPMANRPRPRRIAVSAVIENSSLPSSRAHRARHVAPRQPHTRLQDR